LCGHVEPGASNPLLSGDSAPAILDGAALSKLGVVDNGVLVGLFGGRDVRDRMEIRAGLALPRAAGSVGESGTAKAKA
jgi:hypothetical protein